MTLPNVSRVGNEAYNKYFNLPNLSYNCISHLMDNNELVWKLLYYNTPDAWNKANLTSVQKASLIYTGQEDSSKFRVFMDSGIPDVFVEQNCQIRIAPTNLIGKNRTVGIVAMCFEVYAHYKVNSLSNYTTRIDTIIQQFIEVFNGFEIGGLGKLYFNVMRDLTDKLVDTGKIPIKGKMIYMSTNVG